MFAIGKSIGGAALPFDHRHFAEKNARYKSRETTRVSFVRQADLDTHRAAGNQKQTVSFFALVEYHITMFKFMAFEQTGDFFHFSSCETGE